MMFFYAIAIGTAYLLFCTLSNHIMEKREEELRDTILHTKFKYKK